VNYFTGKLCGATQLFFRGYFGAFSDSYKLLNYNKLIDNIAMLKDREMAPLNVMAQRGLGKIKTYLKTVLVLQFLVIFLK
jgi:hypothetical protein